MARDGTMTWLGIGNVDGRIVNRRRSDRTRTLPLIRGIAGDRLPPLRCTTLDVRLGDTLLLTTDGIDERFADSTDLSGPTREIAEGILAEHAKPNDDALVVVARYLGATQ
jgi:phosphoserine phosphatase RsbX